MVRLKYKRLLLKISGEALASKSGDGIDANRIEALIQEIQSVRKMGVEIGIVLGGGNFWRYRDFSTLQLPRVASDQIGMLATVMNGMLLSHMLIQKKIASTVYSAFALEGIVPKYNAFQVGKDLAAGNVVFLTGGTGSPFFTTDSAAALRALELNCDVLLKATKVDGVYDSDPKKNPKARRYEHLTFQQAIAQNLEVMDKTAFALTEEGNLPIVVFDGFTAGNLKKIVLGEKVGTLITN